MAFFIVLSPDGPDALDRRMAYRDEHVAYWLRQGAAVKVAGAMLSTDGPDATPVGSSFLLEADSMEDVHALIAQDPFTIHGIFSGDVVVQPVRPAMGAWKGG